MSDTIKNLPEKYSLMGVSVTPLTIIQLNDTVERIITSNKTGCIIANHNLHSIYLTHHNISMQSFYKKANYVHIDGMPLVLIGKVLGYPFKRTQRVTYMDWVIPLMELASTNKWRVFYLGSAPGVAKRGAEILRNKYDDLKITTNNGYFEPQPDSVDNNNILDAINSFQPDILMVGMGMPRQEKWILDNLESLDAKVILTCGACMDYIAGEIPTPPRWMGKIGLEWLYRLLSEPGRLWKRYLIEPWFLIGLFLRDLWQIRIMNKKRGN